MKKIVLLTCLFLGSSLSVATPAKLSCKHRFPTGRDAQSVIFELLLQADQSYTANLDILNEDDELVAHEILPDLECNFSPNKTLVTRCHYKSSGSFALVTNYITYLSRELLLGPNDEIVGGFDRVTEEFSLTLDAAKENGERVSYGYGDILFALDECTTL